MVTVKSGFDGLPPPPPLCSAALSCLLLPEEEEPPPPPPPPAPLPDPTPVFSLKRALWMVPISGGGARLLDGATRKEEEEGALEKKTKQIRCQQFCTSTVSFV